MIRNAIQTPRNDLQHHQLNFELDTIFPPDCTTAAAAATTLLLNPAKFCSGGGGVAAAAQMAAATCMLVCHQLWTFKELR